MQAVELYAEILSKNRVNALTTHHPWKIFLQIQMGQRVSPFHGKLHLLDMLHAETFPANNAYAYGFILFTFLKAIVTFQHMTTSTNFIKQAVFLQGFMAGNADNPFDMFNVGLQLDRIVSFPGRRFLMNKVFFANSSPTDNANRNSISIFTFSGAFVTFHCSTSKKVFLYPMSGLKVLCT